MKSFNPLIPLIWAAVKKKEFTKEKMNKQRKGKMKAQSKEDKEKKVKKLLIEHDLSQKQIAEYLDITPQAVNNRIKRGSIEPILEAIEELSS